MMIEQRVWKKGEFVELVDDLTQFGPREVPMPKRWYALQLHQNKETKVMRTFEQRNISAYLPTITATETMFRHRRGYMITIKREVTRPLFPGLVFIPDFQASRKGVLDVDGVAGFLRFGEWVAWLPPERMTDIRTLETIGHIPLARRKRLYALGQIVRVTDGPFAAFNGTIERLDSKGRLSVLVDLFKRMVPVMLDETQIEAV